MGVAPALAHYLGRKAAVTRRINDQPRFSSRVAAQRGHPHLAHGLDSSTADSTAHELEAKAIAFFVGRPPDSGLSSRQRLLP
jgi:hypothetical protein